jgi:hypothetical protein
VNEPAPYRDYARAYWDAGWRGVLPLPVHKKKNPPDGYTGALGRWPSFADVLAWAEGSEGDGNIALRLPPNVIGLDVDQYGAKRGAEALAAAENQFGPLPATVISGSRTGPDGVSGIRLFRVPEGLAWPGEYGKDMEIIQYGHRYAVVFPSVHPDTGMAYGWRGLGGNDIPQVDAVPLLPDSWVAGITGGALAGEVPGRAGLASRAGRQWLLARAHGGPSCRATGHAVTAAYRDLGAGSRHTAAMLATARLVRLTAEGHTGTVDALTAVRSEFLAACADAGRGSNRRPGEAEAEYDSLLDGAINLIAADAAENRDTTGTDPCDNPFIGLLPAPLPYTVAAVAPPASPAEPPHTSDRAPAPGAGSISDGLSPETEQPELDLTSWSPVNWGPIYSGENPAPMPEYLHRTDGMALFYPGRINGVLGEAESGKSWIVLHGVVQAITAGIAVTYLDFEDTAGGMKARLDAMGAAEQLVRKHLAYLAPDEALNAVTGRHFDDHLNAHRPALVVVDGVNAAMTLLGLDLMSNTDATRFSQQLLRPIANRGAAVAYIDHIPKSKEDATKGGIGAQAKRAMTTGAAFKATVIKPFGVGVNGRVRLHVDKDRAGRVRGYALPSAAGHWVADVSFTATPDGLLGVELLAPLLTATAENEVAPRGTALHVIRERLRSYLQSSPDAASTNTLKRDVKGSPDDILKVLDDLVVEGAVVRTEKQVRGGTSYLHTLATGTLDDLQ